MLTAHSLLAKLLEANSSQYIAECNYVVLGRSNLVEKNLGYLV